MFINELFIERLGIQLFNIIKLFLFIKNNIKNNNSIHNAAREHASLLQKQKLKKAINPHIKVQKSGIRKW